MATAEPTSRSYYLEQYADEILPCETSLEGWADWLSRPDANWGRLEAANDGDRFTASVIRWGEDVMVVEEGNEFRLFNTAKDADFIAARFGKGMGWSPENIIDASEGDDGIRKWLDDDLPFGPKAKYFAIGFNEPNCVLVYHTNPPRLDVEAIVQ